MEDGQKKEQEPEVGWQKDGGSDDWRLANGVCEEWALLITNHTIFPRFSSYKDVHAAESRYEQMTSTDAIDYIVYPYVNRRQLCYTPYSTALLHSGYVLTHQ